MAWYVAYEKIKSFLLRINTENGFGTGFLLAYNRDHSVAAIATAAHVVQSANEWGKPLKLGHYGTREISYYRQEDRVIWTDLNRDAATILISSETLPLPPSALPLMNATQYKRIGVEVGWVGFPALVPDELCFFSGKISTFLSEQHCYLIDGIAINGVSGGPVFGQFEDGAPEIIGVVSAYLPSRHPAETLPGFLRAQDVTPFHEHIKNIRNFDEAKEKEKETQEKLAKKGQDA